MSLLPHKMNTKLLMTLCAITLGLGGIALSFMPAEIIQYVAGVSGTKVDTVILQLLGAVYFGFAMINWTARSNMIGGIYARPVSIGNLTHFVIGALALLKAYSTIQQNAILGLTIVYCIFAVLFTMVFFSTPAKVKTL